MRQLSVFLVCILLLSLLSACNAQGDGSGTVYTPSTTEEPTATEAPPSDFDAVNTWGEDATTIVCDGAKAEITGPGVTFTEGTEGALLIDNPGTYVFSGTFLGTVQVTLKKTEQAQIVLNGVLIRSDETAAINITSADKVVITLAPGTENTLSDGPNYAAERGAEPNACLFSKDDLTINGSGSLRVLGNSNNGIGCKDDLRILDGTITVDASRNALKGNDSVRISGGDISVTVCSDAIKSDNEVDPEKGYVSITGGTLHLVCEDDGIQAVTAVTVKSPASVTVSVKDEAVNCPGDVQIDEGCLIEK